MQQQLGVAPFVSTMLNEKASWRQDLEPALASAVVTRLLGDRTIRLDKMEFMTAKSKNVRALTCQLDVEKAEAIRSQAVLLNDILFVVDTARGDGGI